MFHIIIMTLYGYSEIWQLQPVIKYIMIEDILSAVEVHKSTRSLYKLRACLN